jgi:hypothetical protein
MKKHISFFAIVVVISMTLSGCFLPKDNKKYPEVAVGERFSSFGFDGYCRKLPNEYMIEIIFGGCNTAYKINNYEDVMQNAIKIIEDNVEYYLCVENIVFFTCTNKNGETSFFSLDTAGEIGNNLTVYVDEAQLLNDNKMDKIYWIAARPKN